MLIPLLAGLLAIVAGIFLTLNILRLPDGNDRMRSIASAIQEGATAYLNRQYTAVGIVAVVLAVLLAVGLGLTTAIYFLVGAIASALAGYIGMNVAVRANVRTAQAAHDGLPAAMRVATWGGAVTGLFVVGLGLVVLAVLTQLAPKVDGLINPDALIGLGFGTSLISVFARLGGGIYTKAADVGADLVGKVEAGIPEDDPRNPAVIADNVGDNVGDDAGMAADLFETLLVTAIAAMLLGHLNFKGNESLIWYPLIIGGIGAIASIAGVFGVGAPSTNDSKGIMGSLYRGVWISAILATIGIVLVTNMMDLGTSIAKGNLIGAALVGIAVTMLLMYITDYYTSAEYQPVRGISRASITGHGTNIIAGLAVGMKATALPVLVIAAGTLASFALAGVYGVAIAAMTMLSLCGIIVTVDAFGPITDNAGGIAEMAELDEKVRNVTDPLDAVGNTTKAVTKGYAIGSAGLAALALFASYTAELSKKGLHIAFDLSDPLVVAGLFIGGILPCLFAAISMEAVGRAAGAVVIEVRRQFKEMPGIMKGTQKPDYAQAVGIVTEAALREMRIPALIPVLVPILVGLLLGAKALGGLLVGSILVGLFMAIQMTTGGGAWDNAKKYIESGDLKDENGNVLKKGSFAHQASVTGDTVGDPYKDTAGPAINPMIKVANIVALLIAPFLTAGGALNFQSGMNLPALTASAGAMAAGTAAMGAVTDAAKIAVSQGGFGFTYPAMSEKLDAQDFLIEGTATSGEELEVFDGDTSLGKTTVAANGKWNFLVSKPSTGNHNYMVHKAGGDSLGSLNVMVEKGLTNASNARCPCKLRIGTLLKQNISGATIHLLKDGKEVGSGTGQTLFSDLADGDYTYSIEAEGFRKFEGKASVPTNKNLSVYLSK